MRNFFRTFSRLIVGVLFLWMIFVAGRALTVGKLASAASNVLHPQVCLGGWENAALSQGEPSLPGGASSDQFSKDNSSFLDSNAAAALYCTGFLPEPRDAPPYAVSLEFQWAMVSAAVSTASTSEASLSGTTFFTVISTTSVIIIPAFATSSQTDESSVGADADTSIDSMVMPTPVDLFQPAQLNDSAPTTDPATTNEPSSMLLKELMSILRTPIAQAQTVSAGDFFSISYSIDGVTWVEAGKVNKNNFAKFTLQLPITSWNALGHLQIKIETLPATETRLPVYLDAILLRVQDDPTVIEVLGDQAQLLGDVLDKAGSLLASAADATLELLSNDPPQEDPQQPIPSPPAAMPVPPAPHTERKLTFAGAGSAVAAQRVLPWYDNATKAAAAAESSFLPTPDISITHEGLSLTVKGVCTKKYFAVLTFRGPDDYKDRPQTFASNYADLCKGGTFNYDFSLLPLDTSDGTYYLLTADQEEKGAWIPSSALLPISINHRDVLLND